MVMNEKDVSRSRLRRAAAIVCALVVAVPASGLIEGGVAGATQGDAGSGGIRAADIMRGGNPFESLARLEQAANGGQSDLPAYFTDEIGLPEGAFSVRVSEDGDIVGCTMKGDSSEAMERVRAHMNDGGWSEVTLGEVDGATFMKAEGSCAWVLVTCTQVGDSSAVVFRSVMR